MDYEKLADVELDALVACCIMGKPGCWVDRICINDIWVEQKTWIEEGDDPARPQGGWYAGMQPRPYTTDANARDLLVEKMRERGFTGYLAWGQIVARGHARRSTGRQVPAQDHPGQDGEVASPRVDRIRGQSQDWMESEVTCAFAQFSHSVLTS